MRAPAVFLLATLTFACTRSDVVRTAMEGDLASLKKEIAAARAEGELGQERVEEIAAAVAGREVRSAEGDLAVERIRSARACLAPLEGVLSLRSKTKDDPGAEAMLALVAAGRADRDLAVSENARASSAAWRAVAARAAVSRAHASLRRSFYRDADERVRRAALECAVEATDAADLEELLETARVDPDPLSRSAATRAVGAVGTERAVLALLDYWPRANEHARIAIVDAWAMRASFSAGGERELVRVAEAGRSLPGIAAAEALARSGAGSANTGVAILARAIAEGTATERILAIRVAPIADERVLGALAVAAKSDDGEVQVVALARLLSDTKRAPSAKKDLRRIAKGKDERAERARAALAAAQDPEVAGALERDLGAESPATRVLAAVGLVRLGRWAVAAGALADDNPRVRMGVACAVLADRRN